MLKFFAFALIFGAFFTFRISAQSLLENGAIPDDLLITLKSSGSWGFGSSETTINARGEFSFQTISNLPQIQLPELSINRKRPKPVKYLTPKLSAEKLRALVNEFEKAQFFRFGKDFPVEDEGDHMSITDIGSETISVRLNGQTKEVYNYLGDFSLKRSKILRELAERIRGASIWNYENNRIPENTIISYKVTNGDKIQKELKIDANGKITENVYAIKFHPDVGKELNIFLKSKKVGKISKTRLRQLLDEFEKNVFSTFRYSILSKENGCANPPTDKRTHISVQINRASQIYASLYENCAPTPETEAAKFESTNAALTKLFKDLSIIN